MATMASAVRDIATTPGRDNLTAVAARSVPVATHPTTLPTPPNSISPSLPPHGLKAQLMRARLDSIDSDLDLLDSREEHHEGAESPPYDSSGAITSAMLAKFHLPEILLNHGPLPIRHLMGYLTTSVPGFAGIPPAKARRLVVGALEGKGSGNEGGGLDGDVEFVKVGWGRWDAKRRGQPGRDGTARRASPGAHPNSIPISGTARWNTDRSRLGANLGSSLGAFSSAAFSHDDRFMDMDMMDHEADKMSLDGSGSASCSEAPEDDDMRRHNDDPEDATDDEDWAAVGAAALRASSYQARSNQQHFPFSTVHTSGGAGIRSFSAGMARPPQLRTPNNPDIPASAFGPVTPDAQEREAVEALLRLGSM
ncbi:putative Sin3 binding protein-domain-containing protein [Achaetomium macrosporum]|uniref:Sin3 binding protein-domain-containing protein n=1 Tax=Achaetomium macrosporum TaxID=79813 RepID=A0AAN7C8X9_9PEZI|nr:putative Sin3 binding protein-domain-containing protein [Achaetomium macrosporum]